MPARLRDVLLCLPLLLAAGCSGDDAAPPVATPTAVVESAPLPGVALPAGPLVELVPTPQEVPAGMVPLLTATGPRDVKAIAAFSADPAAAEKVLLANGFGQAYAVQYANPDKGNALSVVVTRFATAAGATADLAGDLAAPGGTLVASAPTVGDLSQVRTQTTGGRELVTVRFRKGATTWLLAYGERTGTKVEVATDLAKRLTDRTTA